MATLMNTSTAITSIFFPRPFVNLKIALNWYLSECFSRKKLSIIIFIVLDLLVGVFATPLKTFYHLDDDESRELYRKRHFLS